MSLLYSGIRLFVKGVTSNYFRKISVIGLENIPKSGPTIVCCNHANQFMDAMLVLAKCPRPLSFCMAASSYSFPIVGYLAKKINVIPVYRPDDSKILGLGFIKMISNNEINGINTKFISQIENNPNFNLGIGSLLIDNKHRVIVEKVESEDKIIIKSEDNIFELLNKEIEDKHLYYLIPKLDNSTLYKEAYLKLHEGNAVCIFPEGTSHDRTDFLKLKAGVALMSLGAMANHNTKNIKILSCGFTYFNRDKFRSDVIIEFGIPFNIPDEWGQLFKENKKEAIGIILKEVENRMKAVTFTAPSFKEYSLLSIVRDLYIPKDSNLDTEKYTEISKRFSKCYNLFKDRKELLNLKKKLFRYLNELENVGLEDNEVKEIYYSYKFYVKKTTISFLLFHVYLLCSLPIIIATSPFVWQVKKNAETARIKAKAKNPNKLEALDVVSSVKVTQFVKYLPFIFILFILIMEFLINYYLFTFTNVKISFKKICIYSSFFFPFYAYLSTFMLDQLYFYLDTMKTRFIFFFYPRNVYKLKNNRTLLENEVRDFVDNYIKETEYANNRIIKPISDTRKNKHNITEEKKNKNLQEQLDNFLEKFGIN